jgi:hypothetical protein
LGEALGEPLEAAANGFVIMSISMSRSSIMSGRTLLSSSWNSTCRVSAEWVQSGCIVSAE